MTGTRTPPRSAPRRARAAPAPRIGMVLGSGLPASPTPEDPRGLPYGELPGFRAGTVAGHAGELVLGAPRRRAGRRA